MSSYFGSVSVADDGTVTKSGLAGTYYDAISLQESPLIPSPTIPTASYTGTVEAYQAYMLPKVVAVRRAWARQANAMASGEETYLGTNEISTPSNTPTAILTITLPEGYMGQFEQSILGFRTSTGPSGGRISIVSHFTVWRQVSANAFLGGSANTLADNPGGVATSSVIATGGAIQASVTGVSGQPWTWRAKIRQLSGWTTGV